MTIQTLHVVLYGRHIGDLTQSAGGAITFEYNDEYLARPDRTPLSLSLPLVPGEHRSRVTRAYLNGLLPDSAEVRERWAQRFGVSPANPFALLRHMGMDSAGAAQFGAGAVEDVLVEAGAGALEALSDEQLGERLAALRQDEAGWTVAGERWSLAGAQSKFAIARSAAGRWCEPTGGAPSTHIVKPGVTGYREQALNEHICMSTARLVGLNTATTEYLTFAGSPALVVTRYDRRRTAAGHVLRVHQEDMCQALGVEPRRKYEASGGPTAAQIARLVDETTDGRDTMGFVGALAFNYLIGAPDAHAKNYSLLLAGSQVRLAPLYDIASAFPYDPAAENHELDLAAMGIGGEKRFGLVTGRHWVKFARQARLDTDEVIARVRAIATDLPDAVATAAHPFPGELASRLIDEVASSCTRARASL